MNDSYLYENKKNIFISIASHLASLWNGGLGQPGNSLLLEVRFEFPFNLIGQSINDFF